MNRKKLPEWYPIFDLISETDIDLIKDKVINKEIFLLYLVHKLRCISPKELSRLFDENIKHSFISLCRAENKELLYSEYTDFYGCSQRVFFATNEGIEKVAELLGTEVYRFDNSLQKYIPNFYNQTDNKISDKSMPHFLATNEFYLMLLKNGISVDWKDSRFNSLFDGDIQKAPIRLDASYQVNDRLYGIEQDMGTTTKQRLLTKFSTYANYYPISKYTDSTIHFSINMGKYLNTNELNKVSGKVKENEKELKDLQREKKKYTEIKQLLKEYPAPPSIDELEDKKKSIEELLKNPVISRWEKRRQEKSLSEIKALINKEYAKPEDNLEYYEQIINNPVSTPGEKRRAEIKKDTILTYKQMPDNIDLDSKINELTLQIRKLKVENDRIRDKKERDMLIELAQKRREIVISYIDYQIHNKENDNTLLDLFVQGLDMYMDDSILLSKFASKQVKNETTLDYFIGYVNGFIEVLFNEIGNTIAFDCIKKVKYENFTFTIDYGIKMYRKDQTGSPIYIDIFDLCDNNVASSYRFKEYMKTKRDEISYFKNRLSICLVSSKEKINEIKERFPYDVENIWFYEEDADNIDFSNVLCFREDNLEQIKIDTDLGAFLKKING